MQVRGSARMDSMSSLGPRARAPFSFLDGSVTQNKNREPRIELRAKRKNKYQTKHS